jgi:hypothetical protein
MSPMMDPPGHPDPGFDVAAEYRRLSAWGAGLEARHAALVAIAEQLNAWFPAARGQDADAADAEDGASVAPLAPTVPTASVALAEVYEILWTAYETELAALNEEFLLLDVGFEVLAQAAERLGIDLDELDDEPGRPWDQDADRT